MGLLNVIRFLPPLVIEMSQLERAAEILKRIFDEEEKSLVKERRRSSPLSTSKP